MSVTQKEMQLWLLPEGITGHPPGAGKVLGSFAIQA